MSKKPSFIIYTIIIGFLLSCNISSTGQTTTSTYTATPESSPTTAATPTIGQLEVSMINEFTQPTDLQLVVMFSPDGHMLASTGLDGIIHLWDINTGLLIRDIQVESSEYEYVGALTFSPDGQLLASGGTAAGLQIWHVSTGELVATLSGPIGEITDLDFSPDGVILAAGSRCYEADKYCVRIWDTMSHEEIRIIEYRDEPILDVQFNPDGSLLAVAGRDQLINLWNTNDWSLNKTLDSFAPDELLFTYEGNTLLGASRDNRIWIWDIPNSQVSQYLEGHTEWVACISLSPDERLLASAGGFEMTLRLWDWRGGHEIWEQSFDINDFAVTAVAFSPTRNLLAVSVGFKVILFSISY